MAQNAAAISGTKRPASWISDLSASARERVRLELCALSAIAETEWADARARAPRLGERPAGSADFDHVLRAQQIGDFVRAVWDGAAPHAAAEATRASAREVIVKHNARCPDDPVIRPGWVRDLESGQTWINAMAVRVERAVGQIDLDAASAGIVWAALWRQMQALQDERDAVHYERRPFDLIDADFSRLVPILSAVRAIGSIVSESTLNEMLREYGL